MADEWRVEVELGGEGEGLSLGERLRTLDLDDEARKRLGDRVVVTRDGPRMFLYTRSAAEAEEAERVIRSLAAEDDVEATTQVTRWDSERDAWVGEAAPPPAEREPEAAGEAEWEARIVMPSAFKAIEVARQLRDEGLEVRRRWRFVLALAPSEEEATALASRLRAEVPDAEQVDVERATGVIHPVFVMLGAAEPRVARDLGL
jgi:hypothetical protein